MEGAVERVRPKMMTVVAIMAGLLPIMWGRAPAPGDEPHRGTDDRRNRLLDGAYLGGDPTIYALVKQWRLDQGRKVSVN